MRGAGRQPRVGRRGGNPGGGAPSFLTLDGGLDESPGADALGADALGADVLGADALIARISPRWGHSG